MSATLIALLAACLIWWLSTGAILIAVRLAERGGLKSGIWTTIAALPLVLLGAWGFWSSLHVETLASAYIAFLSALALWGWAELSFLSGAITGPVRTPCPPSLSSWDRFWRAWGTIAYHEIILTLMLIVMIELSWGAANFVGVWTFVVLYFARVSAKLNLFLGVAHVNTEFLPNHLSHLASHFGRAKLNWLFPVSITALTVALAWWIERLIGAGSPFAETGFALLAALTTLALIEHWFLVLALPDAKLWRWMLPRPTPNSAPKNRMKVSERSHEV